MDSVVLQNSAQQSTKSDIKQNGTLIQHDAHGAHLDHHEEQETEAHHTGTGRTV